MSDTLPPLGDDAMRELYAETLKIRTECHRRLKVGRTPAVEPRSLQEALPQLDSEGRSRLPLVLWAAKAGYADLLAHNPNDPNLRHRMISVCDELDRALDAVLTRLLFGKPAKRKSQRRK